MSSHQPDDQPDDVERYAALNLARDQAKRWGYLQSLTPDEYRQWLHEQARRNRDDVHYLRRHFSLIDVTGIDRRVRATPPAEVVGGKDPSDAAIRRLDAEVRELRRLWSETEDRAVHTQGDLDSLSREVDRQAEVLKGHWNSIQAAKVVEALHGGRLDQLERRLLDSNMPDKWAEGYSTGFADAGKATAKDPSDAAAGRQWSEGYKAGREDAAKVVPTLFLGSTAIGVVLDAHQRRNGDFCTCNRTWPCRELLDIGERLDAEHPGWRKRTDVGWINRLVNVVENRPAAS